MEKYIFNKKEHHFMIIGDKIEVPDAPLTVTLQVTRRCNLRCIYCSESAYIPEPPLESIKKMIVNLRGTKRIIISGGEPLVRKDLILILKDSRENFDIVAMSSNATLITEEIARQLSKYIDYIDVTIDGPRKIHNMIRGKYDEVLRGLWNLKKAGIDFSIVMVLLKYNIDYVPYVAQIADVLGAKKLKILSPIPKGRGKAVINLSPSSETLQQLCEKLKNIKKKVGWNVRITITDWHKIREGHALLVHPNGDVVASPVWTKEECIEYIGNILKEPISKIWERYPYKLHHVKKYIEKSLLVC